MKFKNLQTHLLNAALLGSLSLGGLGCGGQGAPSDEELALGEATAALTSSEEPGDVGPDGVAFAADADVDASATEAADGAAPAPESAGDVCDFSAKRKQVLDTYDENKNGKLETGELRALKGDLGWVASVSPRFSRLGWRLRHHAFRVVRWAFDADGDRQLSTEERAALIDALEARCERLRAAVLAKYDANQDGALDAKERAAVRSDLRAKVQARYQELLTKYDTNVDGSLDATERAHIRADVLSALRARRAALVQEYDTDGNGTLSKAEALPLREDIQKRIAQGKEE
jgi:Ca2+-binding EF-hand superfamily protein